MIKINLFKGGKRHAVTFSYDDGAIYDERLVGIFNKYGIKATFHLCSGLMDEENRVHDYSVYNGHEIACHGATHAPLAKVPSSNVVNEILNRLLVEVIEERCINEKSALIKHLTILNLI